MPRHARPSRAPVVIAVAAVALGASAVVAALATSTAPRVAAQPADPPPAAVERYEVTDLVRLPVVASPAESEPVQDVAEKPLSEPVSVSEPPEPVRGPSLVPERRTEPLRGSTPQSTAAERPAEAPAAARATTAATTKPKPKPAPTTQRSTPKASPTAPALSPTQEPAATETADPDPLTDDGTFGDGCETPGTPQRCDPEVTDTPTTTEPTRERPRWWERWEQREDDDDE